MKCIFEKSVPTSLNTCYRDYTCMKASRILATFHSTLAVGCFKNHFWSVNTFKFVSDGLRVYFILLKLLIHNACERDETNVYTSRNYSLYSQSFMIPSLTYSPVS